MSKTGTEDARMFTETGSDRFLLGGAAPSPSYQRRPALDQTLIQDECAHTDLNAAGDRCLTCGVWAHELVPEPQVGSFEK